MATFPTIGPRGAPLDPGSYPGRSCWLPGGRCCLALAALAPWALLSAVHFPEGWVGLGASCSLRDMDLPLVWVPEPEATQKVKIRGLSQSPESLPKRPGDLQGREQAQTRGQLLLLPQLLVSGLFPTSLSAKHPLLQGLF